MDLTPDFDPDEQDNSYRVPNTENWYKNQALWQAKCKNTIHQLKYPEGFCEESENSEDAPEYMPKEERMNIQELEELKSRKRK